jgi:hypothetical protein
MTLSSHPEELLAEYADGSLGPEDRARVDAHVAACSTCREELELAGSARRSLEALPDLEVPAGTTWPVVQRAQQRRRWLPAMSPRAAWVTAGAAAAAAAVIGAFALVGGLDLAAGPQAGSDRSAAGRRVSGPGTTPAPQFEAADGMAGARYPTFRRSDQNFDSRSLLTLSKAVSGQARVALRQGYPEPPARYWGEALLTDLPRSTRRALACVVGAVSPDRSLAPFTVVAASYEGDPAYIGVFLQAERPESPYQHVAFYVVSRTDCSLRYFARQSL